MIKELDWALGGLDPLLGDSELLAAGQLRFQPAALLSRCLRGCPRGVIYDPCKPTAWLFPIPNIAP